jgi:prevent-host-death family protein
MNNRKTQRRDPKLTIDILDTSDWFTDWSEGLEDMKNWPVQDAKAHFSEMLDTCRKAGPQLVSKRGEPKAVLVSLREWESLLVRARPMLKDLLLAGEPRFDLELPSRAQWALRDIPDFSQD